MASSHSAPIGLRFGAELEVLTGSRANEHMEWYLTANELRINHVNRLIVAESGKELGSVQVKNHVNSDHNKDAEDYSEWSIIQEVTITNQMMQNKWGVELVSPILDFQDQRTWHWHMDAVWWVLSAKFNTSSTPQCSTHVHISPTQGSWTLAQVKRVAKAVLYYERSIDTLLPQERRQNIWAQSNRHNTITKPQTIATLFTWIDGARDIPYIALIMCAFSKDSQYGRDVGKTQDFPPTLEGFRGLLINGAIQSGVADYSALNQLFEGKAQLPPGAYNLEELSPQDLANLKAKAAQSNITVEKFKKLYGYR
ncbi:Amidoligase-2 domain containing protein [Pyrenophora tritici-repentis]|nr:Amidoligase-2 domain containing protein [Pyrenophora tritici-repentis]